MYSYFLIFILNHIRVNWYFVPKYIRYFILGGGKTSGTRSPGEKISNGSPVQKTLGDIEEKLKEIKAQRLELSLNSKSTVSIPHIKSMEPVSDRNIKQKSPIKGKKKGQFYHPNLEYVVEKIIHSPYLTKPTEKYPGTSFYRTILHRTELYL